MLSIHWQVAAAKASPRPAIYKTSRPVRERGKGPAAPAHGPFGTGVFAGRPAQYSWKQLRSLLECQQVCMQRTLEEVQELIRKHNYRFGDEARGQEMTAWRRAAELCAGNPGVR